MTPDLHAALSELCAEAQTLDSPHVDVSRFLGTSHPVLVGLDDLHRVVLDHQAPGLSLHLEGASVSVRREDGGLMARLEVRL